ncbi:hypothetical protein P175DRAFT_0508549 [Aspergillus ochraceoroseus IBT 24754]|uniref:Zn(2)-C6 fungal-type domain-containing protein n=1 Tax=Aspergillus ochraceoroseus IBT 24754 TaxID=1392256 RepID=A0A2T5LZ98_9EURO|nr:uncharacterized protein P175DRAFT_0508549 [Aspergillus ochraceoroseus IBT 24754]PTU21592.1 hypothetical protein P175DRAFT_0508549 [Aspergillus ochraceoroseus IBT 24754]
MATLATAGRRRAFSRKSRTGCQTCRTRHVRCDEAPGSCLNCTSTGRKCDGYDRNQLPLHINIGTNLPGTSSDERRCFAFFLGKTAPMIETCFDSELWRRLVLPMSQAEPAVFHAVVALSALHENSVARGLGNEYHRFSLSQYNRAITKLHQRFGSNDPQLHQVVLTCCIIFFTLELLQGNYKAAFAHLRQGLKIMQVQPGSPDQFPVLKRSHPLDYDPALVETFMRLDLEATNFDLSGRGLRLGNTKRPLAVPSQESLEITSLVAAKQLLASITCDVFCFYDHSARVFQGTVPPDLLSLSAERCRIWRRLVEFTASFDVFLSRYRVETTLTPSRIRGINIVQVYQLLLKTTLEAATTASEVAFDDYLSVFTTVTHSAEKIIESLKAEYGHDSLPTLTMDIGVIPPLYWVCVKCRYRQIRERALHLLESWPHREGPYDSNMVVHIIKAIFAIESEYLGMEVVRETWRLTSLSVEISEDQRDGIVTYALSGDPRLQQRQFKLAGVDSLTRT